MGRVLRMYFCIGMKTDIGRGAELDRKLWSLSALWVFFPKASLI
jgi:hypothetical protein